MSKLSEFLALIPKALSNPDKILEGAMNEVKSLYGYLPQDQQDEILRRRLICRACPFYSLNATTSQEYKDFYGKHYETNRKSKHCAICSCEENLKTSCLTCKCGISADDKLNEKYPIRWDAYIK